MEKASIRYGQSIIKTDNTPKRTLKILGQVFFDFFSPDLTDCIDLPASM